MDYVAMGKRVASLRTRRKLTQVQAAEVIGISASFYGHIERGTRKASVETLIQIANAFSVSTDDILCDSVNLGEDYSAKSKQKQTLIKDVTRFVTDNLENWLKPEEDE